MVVDPAPEVKVDGSSSGARPEAFPPIHEARATKHSGSCLESQHVGDCGRRIATSSLGYRVNSRLAWIGYNNGTLSPKKFPPPPPSLCLPVVCLSFSEGL